MKDRIHKRSQSQNSQQPTSSQEKRGRLILPWYNKMTSEIAASVSFEFDVDIGYKPGTKIGQLVCKSKDSNGKPEAGIYKVPCKDQSCDDIYIGQSGRSLDIRMKEHQNDIRKGNIETSAIALHSIENNHRIDFNSAVLIEPEPRFFHRLFKESMYIRKAQHKMNHNNAMDIENEIVDLLLPITKDPETI